MSRTDFSSRIRRCPRPFEQDRADDARALFPDATGPVRDLLGGTAGCSPFLNALMQAERDWLAPVLAGDPDVALREVLAEVTVLDLAQLPTGLRQAKRRIALLAGLADLGGVWALEQVTGALTDLADAAVHRSLQVLTAAEIARAKIPGARPEDAETGAGMVALAMGKMGAAELNYSSDIDLICLFDESRFDPVDYQEARAVFVKITRRMAALLNDRTADGYVFRTDLRLRPDASVTPVCIAMEAAERYYESVGRTWERAAYVKARPCAGDLAAGDKFLKTLTPFVWRKHLDFTAIQDAHDMRLKIRDHKGLHGPITLEHHDMKLGRGGIREIEFFTQTRQLIAGGRDPELRCRGTLDGLAALSRKGWVEDQVTAVLSVDYRAHREIEHRLQMINDAQTHALPANDGFARLAAFTDQSEEALRRDLLERLERVSEMTEGFFSPGSPRADVPELSEAARAITDRWAAYPALRSDRAREIFARLKPDLLARLQKVDRPDEALRHLDGFLAGLPAGVQLFSLFDANPQLVDLVIDICSTAPHLAQYLARNSAVFDAVIGGDFFAQWPGRDALQADLAARLAAMTDYEAKLDATRRWAKEWHFRIGVHQLRGLIDADDAGAEYADLAGAAVAGLWPHVAQEFAAKHGAAPGRGAMALGMGSLGAGRLTAASDLDLIVIYDAAGVETSDGRRPLSARQYYARFTQALVTALTAPMAEGKLYEVDMRLRPSGRQGPVATSLESFTTYQRDEAWTWEHLALTRARCVAGNAALCAEIEAFREALLKSPHNVAMVRADTADMRRRLAEAKPQSGPLDAKQGPGRMMDIELLAEAAALVAGDPAQNVYAQLDCASRLGWVSAQQADALIDAYRLTWRLQSAARLLTGGVLAAEALGQGGAAFLLRATDCSSLDALAARMKALSAAADAAITRALAQETPK